MQFKVTLTVTLEADDEQGLNAALELLFRDSALLDGLAIGTWLPTDNDGPSDAEWASRPTTSA